jgi:hypothetical protein
MRIVRTRIRLSSEVWLLFMFWAFASGHLKTGFISMIITAIYFGFEINEDLILDRLGLDLDEGRSGSSALDQKTSKE